MDRRRFSRTFLGVWGGALVLPDALTFSRAARLESVFTDSGGAPSRSLARFSEEVPGIDGSRLSRWLAELSRIGQRADGGIDRVAFSDADLEGRDYVVGLMENAGLQVRIDLAGNILGRREGQDPALPPIMLGSHLDSVPAGGNFDGPLGTLGALEVALSLGEAGVRTRHPLEVVVFVNEEGGKTGSRTMAGEFRQEELELETSSGYTIRQGIQRLGGDPDRLREVRRTQGEVAGFLELHVEQGAVLERAGLRIGVVEGIVGIRRWNAVVRGVANHAGTTPMDQREDALLGAARLVEAVNRVVTSIPGTQVGTVGRIRAEPGAPNVIPGEVALSIEVRALEMVRIEEVISGIREEADRIAAANGTPIVLEEFYLSAAAPTDERFRGWVEASAEELGFGHRRMPSGAGHDAQAVAHFAPMGMIFIPSVDGISHSPKEYSRPEDIEAGANTLLRTLLKADAGLDA
jgi:N-carbamoyl-L-amino-acid hydrolase